MLKMDDDQFGVSNKAGGDSKEVDSKKSDESNLFPKRKMMMVDHHNNHHCPFTSDSGWRGGDVGGSSPTCNKNSRPKTTSSSSSSSSCIGDVIGGGVSTSAAATALNTLQPFDIGAAAVPQTPFKSPEGYMAAAASMGFPFTNAQWKELERQAMIYKYMMASLPVPPQLLFPFSLSSPPLLVDSGGGGLNQIRLSNGGDLEPGRCRRTDGKKWRCSRDVAPDQKYCERHLRRGRHRSRKPVELPPKNNINKKTRLESSPRPQFPSNVTHVTQPYNNVKSMEKVSTFKSLEQQRCLDWMMKGEQWQGGSVFNNQDIIVSLENQHQIETPIRGFIDAWSNGVSHNHNNNTNSANISSNGSLSLSSLSLSIGGSATNDDEMGLGVSQTGHQDHECSTSTKLPFSSWVPPASWVASTHGGPLAEVLRPSTVNGDSSSPQATALSSPSGVLQKTLAASSWSDSSGSSSPTFSSSNANNKPVELALLWLNQGKLASST